MAVNRSKTKRRVSGYWLVLGFVVAAVWAAGLVVYATTKVRSSHSAPVVSAEPRPEEPPAVVTAPPGPQPPPAPQPRSEVAPPPVTPQKPSAPTQVAVGSPPPRLVRELAPPPRSVGNDTVDGARFADALAAGRKKARDTDRFLLVVYYSGDYWESIAEELRKEARRRGVAEQEVRKVVSNLPLFFIGDMLEGRKEDGRPPLRDQFVVATVQVGSVRIGEEARAVGYFCLPDGSVLGASVIPPLELLRDDAEPFKALLSQAAFYGAANRALELWPGWLTGLRDRDPVEVRRIVRDSHYSTFLLDNRLNKRWMPPLPKLDPPEPVSAKTLQLPYKTLFPDAQFSYLLAAHPLAPVEDFHRVVWKHVLGHPDAADTLRPR